MTQNGRSAGPRRAGGGPAGMSNDLTLDVDELMDTRIGNFICCLRGPSKDEAIRLLVNLQESLWKWATGRLVDPLDRVLGLKPLKGIAGYFEKRGRTVRIYATYTAGGKLKIVHGGTKKTQAADIARLKKGLKGPRRGRRKPR